MTRWYIDIMPCNACEYQGILGKKCKKGHSVIHVEGCSDCGIMVNAKWYFQKERCPDFEQYCFDDPSGS